MPAPMALQSEHLVAHGISHAFFTRNGGVSSGVYASLNGGVGSSDNPECVAENRARMAATRAGRCMHLLSGSPKALAGPWAIGL